MVIRSLLGRMRHQLGEFSSARGGNVAIIFALALIPLAGGFGAAIDYSRASAAKSAMLAALDATGLMLAKEAKSLNAGQIQAKAQSIFAALFDRPDTHSVQVSSVYDSSTGKVTLNGSAYLNTTLANVLGISRMDISAMTEVMVAGVNLEIALVLDNTGSMANSGKIQTLISASKMFVKDLKKASKKPGDIKISVVPFDTHVKLGDWYDPNWIDWGGMNSGQQKKWTGCVVDRDKSYDVDDTSPAKNAAALYPAEKDDCGLAPILPLSSDFDLVSSWLDKMKASGKTNTTIGLAWGWHALSDGVPMTEAAPGSPKVAKYIVFLTDGQNTQNRWTGSTSEIDARTKLVCNNIRAANINVFTIRIKEGNEALLKSCATTPSMYYDVPAVSEMMKVFQDIAGNISKLRIAG